MGRVLSVVVGRGGQACYDIDIFFLFPLDATKKNATMNGFMYVHRQQSRGKCVRHVCNSRNT